MTARLPPRPALEWRDGAPFAVSADDVYFSRAGGLEEARLVFLDGCGLPARWRGRRSFVIGELGFGTGLNALAAWQAWEETRDPGAVLHFVSVEGFPLDAADAARALVPFAEVSDKAQRLIARWPVRAFGPQRLWFPESGFALTVLHAPVEEALTALEGRFDAWFLDGFAPARNPAMWSETAIRRIVALSAPEVWLATYSVAGAVRRGLADAGFVVEKRPGFAGKRERLTARRAGSAIPAPSPPSSVAIVGAGIAGASAAFALRRRGVALKVLDGAGVGAGASGNPAALLTPRLDRGNTGVARLHLAAWLYALDVYAVLGAMNRTGALRLGRNDRERAALADLVAEPPLPHTHMTPHEGGAWFAAAGVVDPAHALAAMLEGVEVLHCSVSAIERDRDLWVLRNGEGAVCAEAEAVLLANGAGLARFSQSAWTPLEFSRGQIEWDDSVAPPHAIEGASYCAPHAGGMVFGATFDRVDDPDGVTPDAPSRARNLAALATLAPGLAAAATTALWSRAAVRTSVADRAPLAGPAPDAASFRIDAPTHHAGLFLFGALGSRGFTLAPLLGEHLASVLCGEPSPLDATMRAAVDPTRVLVRLLRRRKA